jgi:hypothetical protein
MGNYRDSQCVGGGTQELSKDLVQSEPMLSLTGHMKPKANRCLTCLINQVSVRFSVVQRM